MSRHAPFDGGHALPYRTITRNKVVELLGPLLRTNGGFLSTIVKLPGRIDRFDGERSAQFYGTLLGRQPAIGVACGDRTGQSASVSGNRQLTFLDVHLYFVTSSARSLIARVEADVVALADASADPGIDVAMQCAEELLIGKHPERPAPAPPAGVSSEHGPGVIRHLEFKREEELASDNQITIWEQVYVVGVPRSIDRTRGVTAKLLSIHTNVHPSGEPDAPAPARVEFETVLEESP